MSKKAKTNLTTILLIVALFQGPIFYYFTHGFGMVIFWPPFGIIGLLLTIVLLFHLVVHQPTNTRYHWVGVSLVLALGVFTIFTPAMEFVDFWLQLHERQKIVDQIKSGPVKSGRIDDDGFVPISNGGDISFTKYSNGSVCVEFYIDRGFLDHYSAFVYTDDKNEIEGEGLEVKSVKQLQANWYRVAY